LFEKAITLDPLYGPSLAWAALCHLRLVNDGWASAPDVNRLEGMALARRALESTLDDPGVLVNAATVLAYFGADIDAMMALIDRGLALNPSFARGWFLSGNVRLWAGDLDAAIEHVETSLRLSPRERVGLPTAVLGMAYFFK